MSGLEKILNGLNIVKYDLSNAIFIFDFVFRKNFLKDNKKELQDLLLASIAQCNNSHVHQKLVKQLLKILEVGVSGKLRL